jgi:Protein of unknown function (DUF3703)
MNPALRTAFSGELDEAGRADGSCDYVGAWVRLERAHILSQAHAWPHMDVHLRMASFALRRRDLREFLGQIPRILLAAPGSWTGRAPRGNTGGADVGIFTPMEIPADLRTILDRE